MTRTRPPGHERDTARKRFPVRRDGIASHPLATATVSSPTTIVSVPASPAASNGAPLTRNRPPGQCAAPASAGDARRRSETRVGNRRDVAGRSVARAGVAAAWIGSAPPKSSRSRGSRRPGHSRRDLGAPRGRAASSFGVPSIVLCPGPIHEGSVGFRPGRACGRSAALATPPELAFLERAYNAAIADGLLETNPVRQVKLLKENNARVGYLTDVEEACPCVHGRGCRGA